MSILRIKSFLLVGLVAALSACGGGSSSTPAVQYPVDLAVSDFFQMAHTYNLSATSGSDTYTLDLTFAPGAQASFGGTQAMTFSDHRVESKNGMVISTATTTHYFLATPFTQVGAQYAGGANELDSNQQKLPEFASAGDSGTLDDQTYYSVAFLNKLATGTRTWTLAALTSDTAQFCIHDDNSFGNNLDREVDCYDMDVKGNVTAVQISFEANGQSLTFK